METSTAYGVRPPQAWSARIITGPSTHSFKLPRHTTTTTATALYCCYLFYQEKNSTRGGIILESNGYFHILHFVEYILNYSWSNTVTTHQRHTDTNTKRPFARRLRGRYATPSSHCTRSPPLVLSRFIFSTFSSF